MKQRSSSLGEFSALVDYATKMPHLLMTDLPASAGDLFSLAILAADAGVPANLQPVVLNAVLVEFDGLPAAELYAIRRGRRWLHVESETAHAALDAGQLVVAIGCSNQG